MAAGTVTLYGKSKDDLNITDLTGATMKMVLLASGYTPSVTSTGGHAVLADISASQIATGNGYVSGGATLANDAATAIAGGFKYSSDNVAWTATGGNIPAWRYAVLYASGSLWGLTSPLIGYFLGDSSPANVPATTTGNTLTIACPAAGWFTAT
jgi:hypothetical protein